MKRIKAISDNEPYVTKGKVYEVLSSFGGEKWSSYLIKMNDGLVRAAHKSHFIVVDEPVIEVGSEWIDHKGAVLTVSHVGKNLLICIWNESGREFASSIKNHLKFYKPKPKTVTMYFYYIGKHLCANDYMPHGYTQSFTREIELP